MDAESASIHALREAIDDASNYLTEEEIREVFEYALLAPPSDEYVDYESYGGSE